MPAGRPRKYTDEQIAEIAADFKDFIDKNEDPVFAAFLGNYRKYFVTKDDIFNWVEFSELRTLGLQKQEAFLTKCQGYPTAMAIFRLKQPQHGYRDRTETDITSKGEQIGTAVIDPKLASEFTEFLHDKTEVKE